jgi:hypothetical protein
MMATRYLAVEVSRKQFSTVFLAVDDEDPRFQDAFRKGSLPWSPIRSFIEPALEETLDDRTDWELDDLPEVEFEGMKELPEKEARQYPVFTVPYDPTPAEKRAALEQAGQLALEVA